MKKNFRFVLILGALIMAACSGGSAEEPVALETVPAEYAGKTNPFGADAATDGAKVYQVNCESCHGPQGHGDGPVGAVLTPQPKNLPELAAQIGDDYLFWRISTGKPGTSMAPWVGILTDEQIWQVVTYIRILK